jgi:hypothetical protein
MRADFIGQHKVFFSLAILSAVIIVSVQTGSYYYYEKSSSSPCSVSARGAAVAVQILINYGNGTREWINKTDVPSNWNFYQLTASISRIQSTYYGPPTCEHLVTGINGVQSNQQYFWSLWAVCQQSNAWAATNVGADAIQVTSYHTFAWYYQRLNSQDASTWNPPVQGAPRVTSC